MEWSWRDLPFTAWRFFNFRFMFTDCSCKVWICWKRHETMPRFSNHFSMLGKTMPRFSHHFSMLSIPQQITFFFNHAAILPETRYSRGLLGSRAAYSPCGQESHRRSKFACEVARCSPPLWCNLFVNGRIYKWIWRGIQDVLSWRGVCKKKHSSKPILIIGWSTSIFHWSAMQAHTNNHKQSLSFQWQANRMTSVTCDGCIFDVL